MLTIEAKNKALDSLADAPVGSGIVLSAYGFAATMKAQQQKEAEEKEKERARAKAKAAAVAAARSAHPLVSKRPLPSRRQLLLLPHSNPALASEGLEDGDKENAHEGSYDEGADDEGGGGKDKDEDDDNGDADAADADAAPAAAGGAWAVSMISNAASKFRVAGISRRRRLE